MTMTRIGAKAKLLCQRTTLRRHHASTSRLRGLSTTQSETHPIHCIRCLPSASATGGGRRGYFLNGDRLQSQHFSSSSSSASTTGTPGASPSNTAPRHPKTPSTPASISTSTERRKPTTLDGAAKRIKALLSRCSKMEPLSTVLHEDDHHQPPIMDSKDLEQRYRVMLEANQFFDALLEMVEAGTLNPSGKHGKALSRFCELIMWILSTRIPPNSISVHSHCERLLSVMQGDWNLNMSPAHYKAVIQIALREGKYQVANQYALQQMDPRNGIPVSVDVANPIELYAIAKHAAAEDPPEAVQQVLDAVRSLNILSSQDALAHVLAAGKAMSQAGLCRSYIDLYSSDSAALQAEFGTIPMVSSVLLSSINDAESHQATSAIFQNMLQATASQDEWQWGGSSDRMDPMLLDLGMQCVVANSSTTPMRLFQDSLDTEGFVSAEAFLNLMRVCEVEGNWQDASAMFSDVLKSIRANAPVLVSFDAMLAQHGRHSASTTDGDTNSNSNNANNSSTSPAQRTLRLSRQQELETVTQGLAILMRTCASKYKSGVAMLMLHFVGEHVSNNHRPQQYQDLTPLQASLWNIISRLPDRQSILLPTMSALCLLRCHTEALSLYDQIIKNGYLTATDEMAQHRESLQQRTERYDYKPVGNAWASANKHIHRLLSLVDVVKQNPKLLRSKEVLGMLHSALSTTMRSCTASHQPEAALMLQSWMKEQTDKIIAQDAIAAENLMARRYARQELPQQDNRLWATDSSPLVRAAMLETLSASGRGEAALDLFFDSKDDAQKTPDMYTFVAKHYERNEDWNQILALYQDAYQSGCVSEEIGSLAMKAILHTEKDALTHVRAIVEDMAVLCGVSPIQWTESRYWYLKKSLGFDMVRRLLFWGDQMYIFDEMQLAIEELAKRKRSGLRARNEGVRAIVRFAKRYRPDAIPPNRRELGLVPRTADQWTALICLVLEDIVASSSSLKTDRFFLSDLNDVFMRLGGMQYVNFDGNQQVESSGSDDGDGEENTNRFEETPSFETLQENFLRMLEGEELAEDEEEEAEQPENAALDGLEEPSEALPRLD